MSCNRCRRQHDCRCPEEAFHQTQEVIGRHVTLRYKTICADYCAAPDDDVIDVAAAGLTITLPVGPIPGKTCRVIAAVADVAVVTADDQPIAGGVDRVEVGTTRDFTFASSTEQWIAECCGSASLESLIGPQGVAGLVGAIGAQGVAGLVGAIGAQGVAGLVGGIGPQGIAGLVGALGPEGVAGLVGAIGPAGVAGLVGAVGPQGIAGLVGQQGIAGLAGIVGPQGVAGIAGEIGLTGPPGPTGPAGTIGEYAYVYNSSLETVALNDDVDFDLNGILTAGITHAPGSSVISIVPAGDYEVTWSVSGVEPNQFALVLNGAVVLESLYGSGAGTQQNEGRAILRVPANSTLSLRNSVSAAAVTLQPLAGGTLPNVNASIRILKIA